MHKALIILISFVVATAVAGGPIKAVPMPSDPTSSLNVRTFSEIISGALAAPLPSTETVIFNYTLAADETYGMVTHWWYTGDNVPDAIVRFYIDGEGTPSIDVNLDMGVGIGFEDPTSPWGNTAIGKQAKTGGTYNNMRTPFQRSIVITTMQNPGSSPSYFYVIIRGLTAIGNTYLPISVGGLQLPPSARLRLYTIRNVTFNPLDKVYLTNITGASGALYMVSLAVTSGNLNFLEGCVRCFIDNGSQMLLSSGTEDYFTSAYYFDAGLFHVRLAKGPLSGLTHLAKAPNGTYPWTLSAYRIHDVDPVVFSNSFQLVWRNGDTTDPKTGMKCINDNGNMVGSPTMSAVTTYAWVYQW